MSILFSEFAASAAEVVTCPYVAPGSKVVQYLPLGTVKEGTNQSPQGPRLTQLLLMGMTVEAHMVTRTTVHVKAVCVGIPQV